MPRSSDAQTGKEPADSNPVPPDYNEEGVDLTLIDWMLSLTPGERIQVLQEAASSLTRLRDAATQV